VLLQLSDADGDRISTALDELLRHQILVDSEHKFTLVYDFRHPVIRETLRGELSLSERRRLHGRVATSLEEYYGEDSDQHADELAYHFGQATPGEGGDKAIRYLATAGHSALARYANQEAVAYLREALDRIEARPPGEGTDSSESTVALSKVIGGLARARRRLGNVQASVALWRRVLALAQAGGDTAAVAKTQREIGLSFMAGGRFEEALEEFAQALESASAVVDLRLVIHIQLAQGYCCQATGRRDEAAAAVQNALVLAQEFKRPELLGRVHTALMQLHIFTGQLDEVRAHAKKALALSQESQDRTVEFWSQWAMGTMEGLFGDTEEMERRIVKARKLADEIGSPLLQLELAELRVELAYARGDWTEGLAIGEAAIELARSLGQRTILPRLLVWVSLIHIGRTDLDVADALTREAWEVSGADRVSATSLYSDVHNVVPAHIGRAAWHLARDDWGDAVRIAEAGLAIADRTGYVVWAIHHILPIMCEASIHARNLTRAKAIARRMREEAEAVGNPLGLAWADACDAVLTWLLGDPKKGAVALRKGAEALDSIPLLYDATRLRRQLAGRLAEIGDREGALTELRHVHEVFTRLGAKHELEKTIGQFGELEAEPPPG